MSAERSGAPGRYLYENGLTVHKVLSMAGGRAEKAENGIVRVTRITDGLAETAAVNPDATVLPDDIIVVELEHHKFYVSGEIKNPGGYPYKEGLTVHKAIAMAGGLTEKAARGELQVLRHTNGQEQTLPATLNTLVLPDDIIVVVEGSGSMSAGRSARRGAISMRKG